MKFVFTRSANGAESIHVDGVHVAEFVREDEDAMAHKALSCRRLVDVPGIGAAIEAASDAGFWDRWPTMGGPGDYRRTRVVVDV